MIRQIPGIATGRMVVWLAVCLVVITGCGSPATLYVRVAMEEGLPTSGVEVVALPFDSQQLLDSLAQASRQQSPEFPELEARINRYRRGQASSGGKESDNVSQREWRSIRDSVARLADSLRGGDRKSRPYREAYDRLRTLYSRLSLKTAARDVALRREFAGDLQLAERARRAADSLRAWERNAYRDYPELARSRAAQTEREPARDTTDATGKITFRLSTGRWWLNIRRPDPDNPFLEMIWNVPVTVSGIAPVVIPLTERNRTLRWRH